MSHKMKSQRFFVAVLAVTLVSIVALADASLELKFRDMEPHIGQAFFVRVVHGDSGVEITRLAVEEVISSSFELDISGLEIGASYRIDFYADANGNSSYDRPPEDHAWRIELLNVQADGMLTFKHNAEFTDIAWPPAIDGLIESGEYAHELQDEATGMTVYWHNDASTLTVGLMSPGNGWLSIGFGPERQMQGANIIIASIQDGVLSIEDHYGSSPIAHKKDSVDDILRAAGSELEGSSVVEFAIPLDSGDDQDKALVAGEEVVIILAYHASSDGLTARHSKRSTSAILLDD